MEIISLKLKSKNNPNIFVATTDRGEYDLHSDVIVKNAIKVGEIDDKDFWFSVDESEEQIGFNIATKYIGSKLKTEKQIKDYLYKKEFHTKAIIAILEKLKEYKIINDSTYAEMYIRSNVNFSKNKLKQKLIQAGVKADDYDEKIEDFDEQESCLKQAKKFFKSKEMTKENIDKLVRRLAYMGYNFSTIKTALNQLKLDIEEEE